jgi:hypothetical protein
VPTSRGTHPSRIEEHNTPRLAKLPKGWSYNEGVATYRSVAAHELVIPWRNDGMTLWLALGALGFGAFPLYFLIDPSLDDLPLVVICGGASMLCAWHALASHINTTRIAMTSKSLEASHTLRGFVRASMCASEIGAVTWRSERDEGVVVSWTLVVCRPDGTRRDVWVPLKNEDQARFVAQAIALSYGVPYVEATS